MGPLPSPSLEAYAERRRRIGERLRRENAALVLHGGELRTRSNDTEFRFRPDSDFHYLTGLSEPGALMVLRPRDGDDNEALEFTLFVRPRDPEAEVWSGRRIGPEGATSIYGADIAHPTTKIGAELAKLLDGFDTIYFPWSQYDDLDGRIQDAVGRLRSRNRLGHTPPRCFGDVHDLLGEDRFVKDAAGIASLRRAIDISSDAHLAAMRRVRPGMYEYEIEALIEYEFRRAGSSGPGYGSIVGGGANATILHYVDNCDRLEDGQILLIDAGCEWDLFSGDITRSYPVSGRFTPAQRDLYQIVQDANEKGIERAVVGGNIDEIHELSLRILSQGLLDLNLLEGSLDEVLENELYKRFYMHRTSHWLGVDVHDAGHYTLERQARPLQPGVVLTIEPGLYIAADEESVPEEFRGIGIRVEDDILIRDEGPEVLTARVPKSVAELEAIIGSESE